MENKEIIIIDGVDVSGCPHYIHKDGSCSSQDCECIKCVHNACFYKDYKTKEQECERLKEAIDSLLKIQYQLADSCTKYKQTFTEIKELCKRQDLNQGSRCIQILQKISESEVNNDR